MIARSLEIEVLLYAAATRQTGLIGRLGIREGMNESLLCIIPENNDAFMDLMGWMEDADGEDWNEISDEKFRRLSEVYGITEAEIEIVGRERFAELVSERVALLTVNR